MASSLPAQHPHLALHLTDRALTPIISTSLPPAAAVPSSPSPRHLQTKSSAAAAASSSSRATFTTSPPSSPDYPSSPSSPSLPSPTALSLAHLTTTALTSYQTAKRLTHGAPLRTMVEYPGAPRGPVVLHSYLCPMSLALGTPGSHPRRSSSQGSLTTAVGGAAAAASEGDNGDVEGARGDDNKDDEDEDEDDDGDSDNGRGDDRGDPDVPMLIATVVAPAAHDLKDTRRAAGRLERVAKALQTEWVAQGPATRLPPL